MTFKNTFINVLKSVFGKPKLTHLWVECGDDLTRTCSVCSRVEAYDMGGGLVGPAWDVVNAGNASLHSALPLIPPSPSGAAAGRVKHFLNQLVPRPAGPWFVGYRSARDHDATNPYPARSEAHQEWDMGRDEGLHNVNW